jgi:hypothetical protein
MFLMMFAGCLNQYQQDMIEYLKEENKILREKLGSKRLLLSNEQRIRLAVLGKKLGRKLLNQVSCTFSPDTILKWHRKLVAMKYDGSHVRKYGRPQITEELRNLIIKIAKANRSWGSIRIQGQLKYLGYKVCPKTIANILKRNNLEPCPDKPGNSTWNEFIKTHWESLVAVDFFTSEIYTLGGLTRYMVLVFIDYSTRKVHIAGIIPQADGAWMKQIAKNVTDPSNGFLKGKKYLVHDHDTLFTKTFKGILKSSGIKTIQTPPMSPNMNPFVERFIRSIKHECLNKMLIFGEKHLRYLVHEYVEHYHSERPHQGLDNNMIEPLPQGRGDVACHERIGGLLKTYRRAA